MLSGRMTKWQGGVQGKVPQACRGSRAGTAVAPERAGARTRSPRRCRGCPGRLAPHPAEAGRAPGLLGRGKGTERRLTVIAGWSGDTQQEGPERCVGWGRSWRGGVRRWVTDSSGGSCSSGTHRRCQSGGKGRKIRPVPRRGRRRRADPVAQQKGGCGVRPPAPRPAEPPALAPQSRAQRPPPSAGRGTPGAAGRAGMAGAGAAGRRQQQQRRRAPAPSER